MRNAGITELLGRTTLTKQKYISAINLLLLLLSLLLLLLLFVLLIFLENYEQVPPLLSVLSLINFRSSLPLLLRFALLTSQSELLIKEQVKNRSNHK